MAYISLRLHGNALLYSRGMVSNLSRSSLDYSRVTKRLFLGTNHCCTIKFDKELLKKGVTLDISLEGEMIDRALGIESQLWLPVKDEMAPSLRVLLIGVAAMQATINAKGVVYVHCHYGMGRGPTLVCAYLIAEMGLTVDEAIAYLVRRRPIVALEESQVRVLRQFEKRCRAL